MRICTQISTGKIIEMQSDATVGTLITNAVSQGLPIADLFEEVITQAEYKERLDAIPLTPEQVVAAALVVTDASAVTAAKANAVIKYLATHTPAECYNYVIANTSTLPPQAQTMLANFAVALSVLVRRELR
jgi:hypothetical protein